MPDSKDKHKAEKNDKKVERRSGKDRRKVHTMVDPDKDRRSWNRRKKTPDK